MVDKNKTLLDITREKRKEIVEAISKVAKGYSKTEIENAVDKFIEFLQDIKSRKFLEYYLEDDIKDGWILLESDGSGSSWISEDLDTIKVYDYEGNYKIYDVNDKSIVNVLADIIYHLM